MDDLYKKKEAHILKYIEEKYAPLSIFLYGSFKDGLADSASDFDCLLIVAKKEKDHDGSVLDGTRLDCFIVSVDEIASKDLDYFLPLYDSKLVKDNGLGKNLRDKLIQYVDEKSKLSASEKDFLYKWIRKISCRIKKNDLQGDFRAIGFLAESLEIYFSLNDLVYLGPKKALAYLKANDPKGYAIFTKALDGRSNEEIIEWASYMESFR